MPSPITFTGLGSGLDTESIVKGLVEAERQRRIKPLEKWKTEWEEKIDALKELNQKLSGLYGIVSSMDSESDLVSKAISLTNPNILSATASSSANNGSYNIVVNQLAQAETEVHTAGEDSLSTVINNSGSTLTFQYSYAGGPVITVNVPNGTTLSGLVGLINSDPNNPGVVASTIFDGTKYHLQLSGKDTGANNTLVIDPNLTATLTGYTNGTFTESQTAQNAQLKLNGYPSSGWIERATNTINDLITGVTLNLFAPGSTSITISNDLNSVEEKLQNFLDSYNELLTAIKNHSYYDPNTKKAGILYGNYAAQIIESRLKQILYNTPPGFLKDSDTYTSLLQIGFYTDMVSGSSTKGKLLFDKSTFEDAFSKDPQGVIDLLVSNFKSITTDANITFLSKTSNSQPGIYDVEIDMNNSLGRFRPYGGDWHPWQNLEIISGNYFLTGAVGYPEEGIALKINYPPGSGTYSATVRFKNGTFVEVGSALKSLISSTSGPFNVLIKNYEDIIDNIDGKLEREQERLAKYEDMLKERYARLEGVLNEMNETLNYLSRLQTNQKSK